MKATKKAPKGKTPQTQTLPHDTESKRHSHYFRFDEPADYDKALAACTYGEGTCSECLDGPNHSGRGSREFTGCDSYAAAVGLWRGIWPEGVAMVSRARVGLPGLSSPRSIMPQPMIADEGDEPLIDRFLDGESDHWLSFPPVITSTRGKIITVLINAAVSAGVSAEKISERGAFVLAFTDSLESAGYRVEIIFAEHWQHRDDGPTGETFDVRLTLKRAEDSLDVDRLSFALLHPSMIRRIGFSLKCATKDGNYWRDASQGRPAEVPTADIPEDAIYFPCLHLGRAGEAIAKAKAFLMELTEE